jgi:hypothetical protein
MIAPRTIALLASLVICSAASADTVDNPGDFALTFDTGIIKIGSLDPMSINQLSISGSVDSAGNITVPVSGIVLPDATISAPIIGNITVRYVPLADSTGVLNPLTGESSATLSIRVRLINPFLPSTCAIDPINVTLTNGSDGSLTGVGYDPSDGTVTYVNNTFAVPRSQGCGLFAGSVDGTIGLPSPAGNNYIDQLHGTFDPVLVGS